MTSPYTLVGVWLLFHVGIQVNLWNGTNSCPINVSTGVRQGGLLSPILFNVYMDELLLQRLQQQDIGCHIGTIFMGALCYADDLITLCPTRRGLQKMINVCQEFAY